MLSLIANRTLIILALSLTVATIAGVDAPRRSCHARAAIAAPVAPAQQLTGKLLIASNAMPDNYFTNTRILLLDHDESGALGVVINRPMHGAEMGFPVLDGGPVGRDSIIVIHDKSFTGPATEHLFADLAVTTDASALKAREAGAGPEHLFVAWGYAGWGPGQLEGELLRGAWHVEVPASPIWSELSHAGLSH